MKPEALLTAASVLFGFLFAGFWWALNRELTFEPSQRHFKPGYLLLLGTMAVLAIFGMLVPLRDVATANPAARTMFYGVSLAVIGVFGYMLTELGHYGIFRRPKYTTWQEQLFFWPTLAVLLLGVIWLARM